MDSTIYNGLQMMSAAQALQKGINLTGDGSRSSNVDFQKLMEQAQSGKVEQEPKTEKPAAAAKKETPAQNKEEDPLTRLKKLAEQGYALTQPNVGTIHIDIETGETLGEYKAGEYVLAQLGESVEVIPVTDLAPWQQLQLQQMLDGNQPMDVSDPEADALLEATAPGADNSPAAMLERIVAEQTGQDVEKVVEEVQPQQEDDDQVELIDVEQGPQRVFHDVEAAPVKVGETESPVQTEEPDVAQQVDAQLIQAMQRGESVVRVQLNPENLGTVTVEISQSADGVLRIALNAHSSETRGLLERHAADLQGLVSSRTQQTVEVNVQRGQESQQHQQNYDGHNGHAQDGQERRRRQQEPADSRDFMQQLRLGLIPTDGEL